MKLERLVFALGQTAFAFALLGAGSAAAQDDEPIDIDAEPAAPGQGPSGATGSEEASAESKGAADEGEDAEAGSEDAGDEQGESSRWPVLLAWYGSLESDIGFAHYDADAESATDDTLEDHRGRFVF